MSNHRSTPSRSPSVRRVHASAAASSGRRRASVSGSAWSQSPEGAVLAATGEVGECQLDQVGGQADVVSGERVRDGVRQEALAGVPPGGLPVQLRLPLGAPGAELGAERVGEQAVVAEPAALAVQRDHEDVLSLEGLEHGRTVVAAGEGVAQRAAELRQDGGVEQELRRLAGLAAQHLLEQVVEHEPVAAAERVDEPVHVGAVGMGAGRERRQLQPGRPALSARLQGGDVLGCQTAAPSPG